jgi:hypothetical protein
VLRVSRSRDPPGRGSDPGAEWGRRAPASRSVGEPLVRSSRSRAAGAESRGAARSARGSSPGCGEAGVEHVPRVLDSKAVRGVGQHESRGACQQCGSAESPVQTADSSASLRESLPRKVARSLCLVNRRRDSVSSAGLGLITFPPDRSAESRPRGETATPRPDRDHSVRPRAKQVGRARSQPSVMLGWGAALANAVLSEPLPSSLPTASPR